MTKKTSAAVAATVMLLLLLGPYGVLMAEDHSGTVTIDQCSTDGTSFSASGTYEDEDNVKKITVYISDRWVAEVNVGSSYTYLKKGPWSVKNIAVPDGEEGKSVSITVEITDFKGNATSTETTCTPN